MSSITLSVLGMYRIKPEILGPDNLLLPDGVDRDTLLPLILAESAELETAYPNPDLFATVCRAWSTARRPSWERMLLALTEEYNPLHNYDRQETEATEDHETHDQTDAQRGTVSREYAGSDTVERTGTDSNAKTGTEALKKTGTDSYSEEQTSSGNTTKQVTGYNASALADNDKSVTSGTGTGSSTNTHNTTDTTTHNTTDTTTHNTTDTTTHDTTDTETRNLTTSQDGGRDSRGSRTLHVAGNIGVTTSAQMLAGELDIRATDIYHIIMREFVRYFCLLVY